MVVGVDIGGNKTLVGAFETGQSSPAFLKSRRIPTQTDFQAQYNKISECIKELTSSGSLQAIVVGSRGEIGSDDLLTDRKILGWVNVPLKDQLARDFNCPTQLFSDAALATLAEAKLGAGKDYERVFYCTISSGIGTGFALRGELILDRSGGGDMVVGEEQLDETSRAHTMEKLVSGSAIKKHFGQMGSEIKDPAVWEQIAEELALVLNNFIVLTQPQILVIGGGIGEHFSQYESFLRKALEKYNTSQYSLPVLAQAAFVEDGVIYGAALKAQELASRG